MKRILQEFLLSLNRYFHQCLLKAYLMHRVLFLCIHHLDTYLDIIGLRLLISYNLGSSYTLTFCIWTPTSWETFISKIPTQLYSIRIDMNEWMYRYTWLAFKFQKCLLLSLDVVTANIQFYVTDFHAIGFVKSLCMSQRLLVLQKILNFFSSYYY